MPLLPRWRSLTKHRAQEEALEQEISALQAALDQCKGMAEHWWDWRTGLICGLALAAGFALGVYSGPLADNSVELARAVGIASAVPDADAANEALQKGDYATALKIARPLADDGDARAQSIVALLYYRGRGVAQNDQEAATWFRRAADQDNALARFYLGGMYAEGRGVPQDYAEAAKWTALAAEQGDAQAQYNLGLAYARGEGVKQDIVTAYMWFNLAAASFPASDARNRTVAVKNRDTVAGEMTADQITEAQKRARDWKPK